MGWGQPRVPCPCLSTKLLPCSLDKPSSAAQALHRAVSTAETPSLQELMFLHVNKRGTLVAPGRGSGSSVIPFLPTEIHPFLFAAEHFSLQCSYDAVGLETSGI